MMDILQVVGDRVDLKKRGNEWVGLCCFHDERTPSLSVSPDKGVYYCHGCGAGGDAIRFMMEFERLSFPEAVRALGGELVPASRAAADARAAERARRGRWRWFAGLVFESLLDLEEHWMVGGRTRAWGDALEPDVRRLLAKVKRRAAGERLLLTDRERGAVNFVCSAGRVDRDRVRSMYGL